MNLNLGSLKNFLELLCNYNRTEITHRFYKNNQPIAFANCLRNTTTIQVTFIQSETIEHYESVEEAASVIHKLIN
ncbi:hypothetical protein BA724_16765 [Domibacillus iocasae]|uniref:Uncharacterized protein n=1 Tax=Domibacillus iocasae TaxID=1714016 RepID=A0A1E7DSF9_9BACI|nr:hypothetical protein BA724_16765 [Domibacillus iocasae]